MRYGFRVYRLATHKNGRGDEVPWNEVERRMLYEVLESFVGEPPAKGTPRLRKPADGEDLVEEQNPPSFQISELIDVGGELNHFHFVVSYGVYGRHRDLHAQDGTTEDISAGAATERFRVDILLPSAATEAALLIIEVSGGQAPQSLLRSHLVARAKERANRGGVRGTWFGYRLRQHPDAEWLRDLIKKAKSARAVFKDTEPSSRGRTKTVLRVIELNLKEDRYTEAGIKNATGWLDASLSEDGEPVAMEDAVGSMIDDFGLRRDALDDLGFDIDDVSIVLDGPSGAPRLFTPNLVKQAFTYPVSTIRPGDVTYYDRVVLRVQNLVTQYDIKIRVPSATEVEEACLTASALAPSPDRASGASATALRLEPSVATG